jgi:methylmalonyl-CoA/ethylmalonyl-CoA epimerase
MSPLFTEILQIGFVVKGVEETADRYVRELGIGPWEFYVYDQFNVREMRVHDEGVDHAWRAAGFQLGRIQLELIEPLDDKSLYAKHLETRGEGIRHILFGVNENEDARNRMERAGHRELGTGVVDNVRYSYFDTEQSLGCVVEILFPAGIGPKSSIGLSRICDL